MINYYHVRKENIKDCNSDWPRICVVLLIKDIYVLKIQMNQNINIVLTKHENSGLKNLDDQKALELNIYIIYYMSIKNIQ